MAKIPLMNIGPTTCSCESQVTGGSDGTVARRGNVVQAMLGKVPAGTYTNSTDLFILSPPPLTSLSVLLRFASDPGILVVNVTTEGKVRFNNGSTTLAQDRTPNGIITYLCD